MTYLDDGSGGNGSRGQVGINGGGGVIIAPFVLMASARFRPARMMRMMSRVKRIGWLTATD